MTNSFVILGLNMSEESLAYRLVQSCQKNNYKLDFYGSGVGFRDYRQAKIDLLIEALKARDEKYVMVTDGHDSWLLTKSIFKKYKAFNKKIVISGNKDHYPTTDLYDLGEYPTAPTSFRFICSSQMIGERKALIRGLSIIQDVYKGYTDQEGWNLAKVKNLFDFEIDYYCKLFINMTNVSPDELSPTWYVQETKSYPASIHFGGPKGDSPNAVLMNELWQKYSQSAS